MPERVVFASALTHDAADFLRAHFPAGHELRTRPTYGLTDDDLAWATVLCNSVVPAEKIARQQNIRWLHVSAAGVQAYAGLRETRPDLRLTSHGAFNAPAVAEHGLALLFALQRRVPAMVEGQRTNDWVRESILAQQPKLIRGSEVHVLGYGTVARASIDLLVSVGANLTVYRREGTGHDLGVKQFFSFRDLHREIGRADIVISILPALPETDQLIDRETLGAMKRGATLINLGRSNVLDHAALIDSLKSNQLANAALDVFDEEPLPPESPLWAVPNLLISPHVAGQFHGNTRRGAEIFLQELDRHLQSR